MGIPPSHRVQTCTLSLAYSHIHIQLTYRTSALPAILRLIQDAYTMGSTTDWDAKVVIGNKARGNTRIASEQDVSSARRTGAAIDTDKKSGVGNKSHADPNHQRIAALDRKDDPTPPPTVSADVGKAMQNGRKALEMTQKDLAQKSNEKPTVIADYEAGRAIPSPQILAKLEKILKVKLRGKDIGTPLLSPSERKAQEAAAAKAPRSRVPAPQSNVDPQCSPKSKEKASHIHSYQGLSTVSVSFPLPALVARAHVQHRIVSNVAQ